MSRATKSQRNGTGKAEIKSAQSLPEIRESRSLAIARGGVTNSRQFAMLMSALMSDVIEGTITASETNAAVNAGGKLLKCMDLQQKYGSIQPDGTKVFYFPS